MSLLGLLVVGIAAGFIATRLMGLDADPVSTIAIGVFGALAGGLVIRLLAAVAGLAAGFAGAVLGAVLLIWLWRLYGPRRF